MRHDLRSGRNDFLSQAELHAYSEELVSKPAIIIANKIDRLKNKDDTLSVLSQYSKLPIVAISALPGVPGFSNEAIEDLKHLLSDLIKE